MATLDVLTLSVVMGSYSGYHYEQEASVTPLLGRDPAAPDKNEIVQTTAKVSKVCTFECYADNTTKNSLDALLFTQTTHDPGDGTGSHNVNVVSVQPRIEFWAGGTPTWIVAITVRER